MPTTFEELQGLLQAHEQGFPKPVRRHTDIEELTNLLRVHGGAEPLPPPHVPKPYEQPPPEPLGWREYIGEAAQAVPRGALTTAASAAEGVGRIGSEMLRFVGLDGDVSDYMELGSAMLGQQARKATEQVLPVTPGFEDSWTRAIGEGVGSTIPAAASFAAAGPAGIAAFGGTAAYANTYNNLKQLGATDESARNYALASGLVGAVTEPFGAVAKGFKIFNRLESATGKWLGKQIAQAGAAEALQEGIQEIPDEVARQAYIKERNLIDSLKTIGESAAVGGVVGTLFGGVAAGIKARVDSANARLLADHEQRVAAGQLDPTPSQEIFREAGFEDGGGTRKERAEKIEEIKQEIQNVQAQAVQGQGQEVGAAQAAPQAQAQGEVGAVLEPQPVLEKRRAAEQRVIEADAAYQTADRALRNYIRGRDKKTLELDETYQSLKAIADAAKKSRSSAEGARTRLSPRAEPTTPEEIAVKRPLHELPERVARTMQEEAAFQLENAKSEKTKAALQKIIDDAGRAVGAAVEKQKQRLLDILSGKIDQRSIYEKQVGAPERPVNPVIDAYKAGEQLPERVNESIDDAGFEFGANVVKRPGIFGQETYDSFTGRQGELPMAPRAESNLPDVPGQLPLTTAGQAGGEVAAEQAALAADVEGLTESGGQGIGPNLVGAEALDKLIRSGKRAIAAVRSAFRARGDLPPDAFAIKQDSEHALKAMQREIRFAEDDLRKAVKAELGTGRLTERGENVLDRALRDKAFAQTLPPRTRAAITVMRELADSYSRRIREAVPMSEKLQEVIAANEGVYLRRTYKAHNDPDWMDKVPQFVRDEFKQQLIDAYPEYNNNQLDALINKMLYDAKEASNPLAFWASAKLGHKDLTGLMNRKDLSEAFRKLLGEEKDPFVNFVRTTLYQSKLLANHKMLSELRSAGLGKWLFTSDDPNIDPRAMAEIAIPGDRTMNPLDGLVTFPEIASEIAQRFHPRQVSKLARWYYRGLFAAKTAKTVLSHTSIIRNAISNPLLIIRNGHWRLWEAKNPLLAAVTELGWDKRPPSRAYLLELQRRGIWDQSTTAQELGLIARGAFGKTLDEKLGGPERTVLRKGKDIGVKLWQIGDNVYRAFLYEAEKARYRKAVPGLPEEQLADLATRRTNQLMPSASMIPKGVRAMQRLPAVETFIGFHAEIIRTSYNTIKLTMQELANPNRAIKAIGAQRLVGMLVAAGILEGLKEGVYRLFGINRKNEKDVERMLYDYQENNPVMLLSNPSDGKVQYIDLAFTDPQSVLRTPVIAAIRGDNWEDSFWQSAKQFGGTFLGENIMTEMLIDIARNQDKDGYKIWNSQDTLTNKFKAIFKRAGEAFVPGSAVSLNRLRKAYAGTVDPSGRSYDPGVETLGQFGFRAQELDIRQRISQKAREFHDATTDAAGVYRKLLTQRGPVNDQEILAAREQAEASRQALFDHIHEDAMSAIRLGVSVADVKASLQAGGVSKQDSQDIIDGNYEPYKPSKQMERNFKKRIEAVPKEGSTSLDEYRRRAKLVP